MLIALSPKLEIWKRQHARRKVQATLDRIELVAMRHAPENESVQGAALTPEVSQDDVSAEILGEARQRRRTR